MITKQSYGTYQGKELYLYTLTGEISATICTLGATVLSLEVPNKDGKNTDVVLGMTTPNDMIVKGDYMGAVIGRCGNRIDGGKFTLNGVQYTLATNNGNAHLHGGNVGFNAQVFDSKVEGDSLVLSLFSPDMQEGYPGNLQFSVKYTIVGKSLCLEYFGSCDKDTLFNPTNHMYFNLNGESDGSILDNQVAIYAAYYLPTNSHLIPIGQESVANTPFDFRKGKAIGRDIALDHPQLVTAGGFDHNFCLMGSHAATAYSPKTGIVMEVYTDMPGVQFYSGNFLKGEKGKSVYHKNSGFCLETQFFPNAINNPDFSAPILRAGQQFYSKTVYQFSTKI